MDLKTAMLNTATLRDAVAEIAAEKKYGNPAAGGALDRAAEHLTEATKELHEANRLVDEQEQEQARLKRPPPG